MKIRQRKLIPTIVFSLALICGALILRGQSTILYNSIDSTQSSHLGSGDSRTIAPESSFYVSDDEKTGVSKSNPKVSVPKKAVPVRAAALVPITAKEFLVGNVKTGNVYVAWNSEQVLPVASMSKLVTAFVVTDIFSPTTTVTVTKANVDVASDTSMLVEGEKFTVHEMLLPMLLNSSNVAAEALASITDRTKFMELMSSYAWEIGMPNTFFADPSGINPHNQSSASDFFALARYLYAKRPDILAITRIEATTTATTTDHNAHIFGNIHPFVDNPDFLGGKTGHTPEAHETMLTIMRIGGEPLAFIVMASDDREADTRLLMEYTKKLKGL